MTNEGFDFDGWREEGEKALAEAQAKKSALERSLSEVEVEIGRLTGALGDGVQGKKTGGKVRIKGVIEKILAGRSGVSIAFSDIYDLVLKSKPTVTPNTVRACVLRIIRANDSYELENLNGEDRIFIRPIAETNAVPADNQASL